MTPKNKKRIRILLIAGAVGFAALQVFPAKVLGVHTEDIGNNPPARFKLEAPPEVEAILRRSCFDCHSNETVWPAYSYVAPISWLVVHDTLDGRRQLNFSAWGDAKLSGREARELNPNKIRREISSGSMPPRIYLLTHPEARLTDAEKQQLIDGLIASLHR